MGNYSIIILFTGLIILNHIIIMGVGGELNSVLWGIPAELLKIGLAIIELGIYAGLSMCVKKPPNNNVPAANSMYG